MKQIIENIQAHLLKEVPALQYVDENWGQLDEYGNRPPVKYPCALIDLGNATFSNIGKERAKTPAQRQQGEAQIHIFVASLKLTNTSGQAPMAQRQNAHGIWQTIEQVHACLQGFKPTPYSGALIRNRLERVNREDGLQIFRIGYSAGLHNV